MELPNYYYYNPNKITAMNEYEHLKRKQSIESLGIGEQLDQIQPSKSSGSEDTNTPVPRMRIDLVIRLEVCSR